jgi:RimJ/RimL family protein N-acetyltransferase
MAGAPLPLGWREAPVLAGRHVRLAPMSREHVAGLDAARDDAGLDGLWYTGVPERGRCDAYVEAALARHADGIELPFVVFDAGGRVAGSTRFYNHDPAAPRLSIGYTWYAPRVQRSGLNTEAKLLLLGHAFETLGCACVTFETSTHNLRSRAAIARLGAKQDGFLRHHTRHPDGSLRDTVVFSIIDSEWPGVKRGLLEKLHMHEVSRNV